ncbi:MAG: methionyl-tRNA formyltransferase [Candidatus Eisenbacteria bacterium]
MRVVFCGSPAFAVPSLERLLKSDHEIACVVTQPDRPAGRGLSLKASPVKACALTHGITVHQPEKFSTRTFREVLEAVAPDLIAVVAYGKILRPRMLALPRLGCVNLHASLLPKYRGVAPANWAIINDETKTGVTTIFMDPGVDTGDVILTRPVAIGEDETAGELLERLAVLGADVLVETCDLVAEGSAPRTKQDSELASYAPKFSKQDGRIVWDRPARVVHNHIRGVSPWPGAMTGLKDKRVKIMRSRLHAAPDVAGEPGKVIEIDSENGILVSCSGGAVWLMTLQALGRRPVTGAEFARGYRTEIGDLFSYEADQDTPR